MFLALIFLMGYLDWLTTVTGVLFRGGIELNPLLSGLTQSSMMLFSATKLTAVSFAGFAAYEAADITKNAKNWRFLNKFVTGGISLTVLALGVVVANNLIIVFKI